MEKPASNSNIRMYKKLFFLFIICFATFSLSCNAQDLGIGNAKKYIIGGIKVTGTTNFSPQTITAYARLRKGQNIYIPGDKISQAIKKLWGLGLFSDINIYVTNIIGNKVYLRLEVIEVPSLNKVTITGLKKEKKQKELFKELKLTSGKKVTENLIANTRRHIADKYKAKGYLNTKVTISSTQAKDTTDQQVKKVNLAIHVHKGDRVKIKRIDVTGNHIFSDAKIRRQMKTKRKNFLRFWKRSKFVADTYKEDKGKIIDKYKAAGYRDARIVSDSIIKLDQKDIAIKLKVDEGEKYYFGNISFLGNSAYSDRQLHSILKINKGDVYNGVLLDKRIMDPSKPDASDLTNLYKNNGYLFSTINAVETKVYNDTIDFEIRIQEGKIAYFDHVYVTGNDRTNDHVIYRNLRTRPGQKYSKQDVIRSIRELGQLRFFDAKRLSQDIGFENANPVTGTLDLHYKVVEIGSSQIQLQGGYGGGGFIGTLGLSFNNFSIKNIFNGDAYHPLPMGDGQKLSLQLQASSYYQTYSISFSEPWLGGKKPIRLTTSFSHTIEHYYNYFTRETDRSRKFLITGGSVGLVKRLEWPDDYFTLSGAISFRHYEMENYNIGLFNFPNGTANNLAFTFALSRDNTYVNPIYPMGGSKFTISAKLTPPYSLFNNVDYANLKNDPRYQTNGKPDATKIDQKRFKWLEYYKLKFKGDWYTKLAGKLVLRTNIEYGFLGAYNSARGIPPFERFYVGGDGLGVYALDGRENIRLRGYPNQSITPVDRDYSTGATRNDGSTIYQKYSLELRYPVTLNPRASIYVLTFAEGGEAFDSFKDFDPFELHRSAGFGIRIHMPQFGLLGIDFGYGFDPIPGSGTTSPNGWETHFIIGQNF